MVAASPITSVNVAWLSSVQLPRNGGVWSVFPRVISHAYDTDSAPPSTVSLAVHCVPAGAFTTLLLVGVPVASKVITVGTGASEPGLRMLEHVTSTVNVVPTGTLPPTCFSIVTVLVAGAPAPAGSA